MKTILRAMFLMPLMLVAGAGHAQSPSGGYPNRPVKMLVPFQPGGAVDVAGRLLAQKLSERLGQTFVIENRGGGGGNIAAALVQEAPADGYTLLITSSAFVINPGLQKVNYDPIRGFALISIVCTSPSILAVNPELKVGSVKELVELIKREPGKNGYASSGVGSTPHLQGEMLKLAFGLDMTHVPFPGGSPALQSTVGGHTSVVVSAIPAAIALVKAGKLRALAIIGPKRVLALPDVPTLTEAGLPDQETETILPLMGPAGTPKEIIDLLYRETAKIVAMPDVVQRLDALGMFPVATTPEETAARIKSEVDMWAKVIRDAKIRE